MTRERRQSNGRLRIGMPFAAVHVALVTLVFVGWSPLAVAFAATTYLVRAVAVTVVFHRGLAHRSFRMPRWLQGVGAVVATTAGQRGPLWWVAHHRRHHRYTDTANDPHSPVTGGFWWGHVGWLFEERNQATDLEVVRDLAAFPELRLLDRCHHAVTVGLAAATFGLGAMLARLDPTLRVSGVQFLIWGFCLPTVALWHATFAVNSFGHRFGRRRFATPDGSRNLWWVALLTLGEGWHNNHHRFPRNARQGLGRWELDPSWWLIWAMGRLGLAGEIRTVSANRAASAGGHAVPARRPPYADSTAATSARASPPAHRTPKRAA